MSISIETLKRIGKEVEGPVSRKGTGKKKSAEDDGKMPRAEKCPDYGSKYCLNTCSGHSSCKKNIWRKKEIMGFTLIQPWMGVALQHPTWIGKWKKL